MSTPTRRRLPGLRCGLAASCQYLSERVAELTRERDEAIAAKAVVERAMRDQALQTMRTH